MRRSLLFVGYWYALWLVVLTRSYFPCFQQASACYENDDAVPFPRLFSEGEGAEEKVASLALFFNFLPSQQVPTTWRVSHGKFFGGAKHIYVRPTTFNQDRFVILPYGMLHTVYFFCWLLRKPGLFRCVDLSRFRSF